MNDYGMAIVGAGETGVRAALELREQGWSGSITLVGGEERLPYERPPLSKQALTEENELPPIDIVSEQTLVDQRIRYVSGAAALSIDRENHRIALSDGSELGYERLLLATGALPRRLSLPGAGTDGVLYLRTHADALALRQALQPGRRIAVIGGGFIGLETAASAVKRGCRVHLIEAAPRILMRGVPEPIAQAMEARHREAGVEFTIGVGLERVDMEGGEFVVALADGRSVRADAVIAGIGAVPVTGLAEAAGLAIDNGIRVDEMLFTSDPDILAAGDCCSFPHPLYGGRRIRLEAWRNARDQGTHAARNMLSGSPEPYAAVPWFWSDQYDLTIQVAGLAGMAEGPEQTVMRDLGAAGKLYFHLGEDGTLRAVSGIGPEGAVGKDIRLAEMLIERRAQIAVDAAADPAVKLKGLLRGV